MLLFLIALLSVADFGSPDEQGSFGEVYVSRHASDPTRLFAIKFMVASYFPTDAAACR